MAKKKIKIEKDAPVMDAKRLKELIADMSDIANHKQNGFFMVCSFKDVKKGKDTMVSANGGSGIYKCSRADVMRIVMSSLELDAGDVMMMEAIGAIGKR